MVLLVKKESTTNFYLALSFFTEIFQTQMLKVKIRQFYKPCHHTI